MQGKKSFSDSKLEQLNFEFNNSNNTKSKISSNEIYIVASENKNLDLESLKNILNADNNLDSFSFLVGPRSGTISPWSSKTEDIVKNVGIKDVDRVERFNGFSIADEINIDDIDLSMFFDRMTQSIYLNSDECINFLNVDPQRSISVIDILKGGIKTLEDANKTFGFAMSSEEIEYLYDFYSKAARNPTDAELMMFAQANSEHCRHKIFNAKWTVNGAAKNNSLFDLIKETSKQSPKGIISAYKDNAAITEGESVQRLNLDADNNYAFVEDKLNSTIKVETHNHPTAISPYPGEFGRPSTLGYFRSYETHFDQSNKAYGYHKPIMLAGGIGEIRDKNNFKLQITEGYHVVVLGGPAMLIGLGGGAASSVSSGDSDEDLDFASVQRDNAEMERRCQEVINVCSSQDNSYIEFIHDVGAGGLSNAIPELAKDSNLGVYIELDKIPNSDKSMSPMEIWSNESQERYVLAIYDSKTESYPVNVPLSMLFGDLPITDMSVTTNEMVETTEDASSSYEFADALVKTLQHPTVASKSFLITIGDRTVGGMVARDQFVGPYQVPVSDYSMSLRSFTSNSGEVLTVGEKPTLAVKNPGASMRMAVAEALTNMIGVNIKGLDQVQVSANWMAASGEEVEDLALREGVESLSKCCVDLNISVPVGKDSLSMRTKWDDGSAERVVKSPLSGVITAMAPVADVRNSITPELDISASS
ncbi:MAG: phosphoribosylformylglycinamidine synthase, partial [Proteobacteria bacterium]|nr:phosphoribosylformylglycinamidine synthase [Pseudomonadota bacterium]